MVPKMPKEGPPSITSAFIHQLLVFVCVFLHGQREATPISMLAFKNVYFCSPAVLVRVAFFGCRGKAKHPLCAMVASTMLFIVL